MLLKGVSFLEVKEWSEYDANLDAYVFELGKKVEITALKKKHVNRLLSDCLSQSCHTDKWMIKYSPSNKVLFDTDLIERSIPVSEVSCDIDSDSRMLRIGVLNKYKLKTGILMLSGKLSANGYIEQHYDILSGSQLSKQAALSKVSLLSLGMRGNKLCGFFHIPRERSLAISTEDSMLAYSTVTSSMRSCLSWNKLYIDDWLDGVTIRTITDEGEVE